MVAIGLIWSENNANKIDATISFSGVRCDTIGPALSQPSSRSILFTQASGLPVTFAEWVAASVKGLRAGRQAFPSTRRMSGRDSWRPLGALTVALPSGVCRPEAPRSSDGTCVRRLN